MCPLYVLLILSITNVIRKLIKKTRLKTGFLNKILIVGTRMAAAIS